jgi:hypothetical protein
MKIVELILWILKLFEKGLKIHKKKEREARIEEIQRDPVSAFENKFKRDDGAPIDYEDSNETREEPK